MSLPSFDKDNTFGALFVGFATSCAAVGVLSAQTWSYYQRYPLDRPFYKCLVSFLWALELADQIFIGHATYVYCISNWGNPFVLLRPPLWSLTSQIILGAFAGSVVKACFAMRVYRFSNRNIPITGMIVLLTVGQMVVACIFTAMAWQIKSLPEVRNLKTLGSFSLGLGVITDMITAASLCYFLHGLRTGYSKDDSLVNRLTLYAVNTGVVTSAVSLATLISYDVMPENLIFMGLYFLLSKLYANSFLATLNTRRVNRGRGTDAENTATMPTFLMVQKMTKHDVEMQQMPQMQHSCSKNSQLAIGIEQSISISKDPLPESTIGRAW